MEDNEVSTLRCLSFFEVTPPGILKRINLRGPGTESPVSVPKSPVVTMWLCSEFSVNAYPHGKTVHILRSSEPEAVTEPPPLAARSVLDRLA